MRLISTISALFGFGCLAGAIAGYVTTQRFIEKAERTSGTVVDIVRQRQGEAPRQSVIRFTDQNGLNNEYAETYASSPPRHTRSETVQVLYDPADPTKAKTDDFWNLWGQWVITGGLGLAFLALSSGMSLYPVLKARRERSLKSRGKVAIASFKHIERNEKYSFNRVHPHRIVVEGKHPITGITQLFYTANLWTDITNIAIPGTFTVYVDPNNPERYHVEVPGSTLQKS